MNPGIVSTLLETAGHLIITIKQISWLPQPEWISIIAEILNIQ